MKDIEVQLINRFLFVIAKDCKVYTSVYMYNTSLFYELTFVRDVTEEMNSVYFLQHYYYNHVVPSFNKLHKFNYYREKYKSPIFDLSTVLKRLS